MSMETIMGGLFLVNGTDVWTEYGVFLTEEKRGGRDNLKAILAASGRRATRRLTSGRRTGRNTPTPWSLPTLRATSR